MFYKGKKMKSVRFWLSKESIDNGSKTDGLTCPIKLEMKKRGYLKKKCFAVGTKGVFIAPNISLLGDMTSNDYQLKLSSNAVKFVEDFDSNRPVEPQYITVTDVTGKYL